MPKYEIEIPDGVIPDGYEPCEFRNPLCGEMFVSTDGAHIQAGYDWRGKQPRMILRKKWQWPKGMPSGTWVYRCPNGGVFFSDTQPVQSISGEGFLSSGLAISMKHAKWLFGPFESPPEEIRILQKKD